MKQESIVRFGNAFWSLIQTLSLVFFVLAGIVFSQETTIVAISGDASPDGNGVYRTLPNQSATGIVFSAPQLNDAGQLGFVGVLSDTIAGNDDDTGLYMSSGGTISQILREGQAVSDNVIVQELGRDGEVGFYFQPFDLNDAGQIAIDDSNVLFRIDDQAIHTISSATLLGMNNLGDVLFHSGEAVYLNNGLTTREIISSQRFTVGCCVLNDAGKIAVRHRRFLPGTEPNTFRAVETLHVSDGENLRQLTEDAASPPAINNAGQVAYYEVIYSDADPRGTIMVGDVDSLVDVGEASAGTGISIDFTPFSSGHRPALNDLGQIAFPARFNDSITGESGTALFRSSGSELVQIFRAAEGTSPHRLSPIAINNLGQVAFAESSSLLFYDDDAGLLEVVKGGDSFLGSEIRSFWFEGNLTSDEGYPFIGNGNGLNDNGQVAYSFTLIDGREGIAVWTVPEPSSAARALIAVFVVLLRNRRRG